MAIKFAAKDPEKKGAPDKSVREKLADAAAKTKAANAAANPQSAEDLFEADAKAAPKKRR